MSEENKNIRLWPTVLMTCVPVAVGVLFDIRPGTKYALFFIAIIVFLHGVWENRNPLKNLLKKKQYRGRLVLAWTAFGALGGAYFVYLLETSTSGVFYIIKCEYERLIAPIFLLIVSAPVSFYLWTCRNADKLQQIDQTEEQNRLNSFSNAMRLFFEKDNKHAKATGLRILAKIKRESDAFDSEIDMATPGVDLAESDLTAANLARINLSRATLTKAKLTKANLIGADLTGASMYGVDLTDAELTLATLDDIAIGVDQNNIFDENSIYRKTYENKFSREKIEEFLKKDWSERKNLVYAQVKKKEENKETYYCFEAVPTPSPSTTGTAPADSSSPIDSSPAPAGSPSATATSADSSNQGEMLRFGIRESESARATRGSADAYFNLGKTKLESGDFDGAIKDFDKALELDANHADAYRLRADARLRKGME